MNPSLLLYLFVFAFVFVSELAYFKLADRFHIIDKPNERSSHRQITRRGGGIVFYISILCYVILLDSGYPFFFIGLTFISLISFLDDLFSVPNRIRLLFHFIALLFLFYQVGILFSVAVGYTLLLLIFCAGIINAFNFMDGINGLTAGYSLVALLTLLYINESVAFIDPSLLICSLLSVVVFSIFNFRQKARCFAGDVGAVSIAFILLFLLLKLIYQTGDWTYIILLALYGVDSILTLIHRLLLRENIFNAHRRHLYQVLANEYKKPHIQVSVIYLFAQLLINAGYLLLQEYRTVYLCFILSVFSAIYVTVKWRLGRSHANSIT